VRNTNLGSWLAPNPCSQNEVPSRSSSHMFGCRVLALNVSSPLCRNLSGVGGSQRALHARPVDERKREAGDFGCPTSGARQRRGQGPRNRDGSHAYALAPDRTVARIVEISYSGRAPKNDSAIFALALGASSADVTTRQKALAALPRVCRTSTHLFQFVSSARALGRGWGRAMKRGGWLVRPEVGGDSASPEFRAVMAAVLKYAAVASNRSSRW
jgi:hypothetical protein